MDKFNIDDKIEKVLRDLKRNYNIVEKLEHIPNNIKNEVALGNITEEEGKQCLKALEEVENRIIYILEKIGIIKKLDNIARKCINLHFSDEEATVFNSKIGGMPYLPLTMEYPKIEDEPLRFFIQINFEEMPEFENFPNKGILQIFLENDEFMYGLGDTIEENRIKIIYHKDIIKDENLLHKNLDNLKFNNNIFLFDFPFYDEIGMRDIYFQKKLVGKISKSYPDFTSRYKELEGFFDYCYKQIENYFKETEEEYITKELVEDYFDNIRYLHKEFKATTIKLGGYPTFCQDEFEEIFENKIVLLNSESDDFNITWGSFGIANFFITEEDLKNLDFSKVIYNWNN